MNKKPRLKNELGNTAGTQTAATLAPRILILLPLLAALVLRLASPASAYAAPVGTTFSVNSEAVSKGMADRALPPVWMLQVADQDQGQIRWAIFGGGRQNYVERLTTCSDPGGETAKQLKWDNIKGLAISRGTIWVALFATEIELKSLYHYEGIRIRSPPSYSGLLLLL